MPQKIPHDHFCNECRAFYPCPNLEECPFSEDPDDYRDGSAYAPAALLIPMSARIAAMNGTA